MALTPCMSCLKQCGYLCGGLAALNIWFWIGMTVFNAMGNPWITKEILLIENYQADVSRFTTVFAICVAVSIPYSILKQQVFWHSLTLLLLSIHSWTSCALLDAAGARPPHATRIRTLSSITLQMVKAQKFIWAVLLTQARASKGMICRESMAAITLRETQAAKTNLRELTATLNFCNTID